MKLLLLGQLDTPTLSLWRHCLCQALPHDQILTELSAGEASDVEVALVANPAPGSLRGLGQLRLIQSLWAGVDRVLTDTSLPVDVPLARMVDPQMNRAMAETGLWATLALHRGFFRYAQHQACARWQPLAQRRADEVRVLLLGWGEMGRTLGLRLQQQGYRVSAWCARPREGVSAGMHPEVCLHVGPAAWLRALAQADILVNLLPLTAQTHGLLDANCFASLPPGSSVVNLARGAHVVEADLLAALDSGHLAHAVLDVFQVEPLPADHRFWRHPQVTVLPHAAAQTDPRSAAAVVASNVQALKQGLPLHHLVDRQRGY